VEIAPEVLCQAQRLDGVLRIDPDPGLVHKARDACRDLPMVVHGVELSIGSATGMSGAYLAMLDAFWTSWPFRWHSEHLSFQTVRGGIDVGVPLPLPPTEEAAVLVGSRAHDIVARYPVPFLMENPAHYLPDLPSDPTVVDEFGLMNRVLDLSGCGQLLDLHNLYCNALNFGFDPFAALERVRLDRVVEVHVAGGAWRSGFLMDAHNGQVPGAVWEMLDEVLHRPSAIAGVVFELLDDYVPVFGVKRIESEIERAKAAWSRRAVAEVV
jgi:hypothetical protein